MPGRLPSLTLVRFWAALMLVAIGLQAGAPFQTPLEQKHGSAFSASTYEMALSPRRSDDAAVQAPLAMPPHELAAYHALAPVPDFRDRPAPRPDSIGPPVAHPISLRPAPRAPPIA